MLNGAAGHTYSAIGNWEAYTAEKPFHRLKFSFLTWKEGMNLPGSYQVGLDAKLLRQYPWWHFEPHPEWVTPRGTTLLEPRGQVDGSDLLGSWSHEEALEGDFPQGEWKARNGNFRLPYAAGIPGRSGSFTYPTSARHLGMEVHRLSSAWRPGCATTPIFGNLRWESGSTWVLWSALRRELGCLKSDLQRKDRLSGRITARLPVFAVEEGYP